MRVELGQRSYEVHIGPGLLQSLGAAVARSSGILPVSSTPVPGVSHTGVAPVQTNENTHGRDARETHGQDARATHGQDAHATTRAIIISDSKVAGLYGPAALTSLRGAGVTADLIDFPFGEQNKTLTTYCRLFDCLFALQPAIDRKTTIIALGGGVSGDLAGFVAATALRGLPFFQCPTTLLAAVDASVGGKTAVDHPAGKNLVGAFHQPVAVIIDVQTLASLPPEELRNGLAECIKHGVIRDESMLDWLAAKAAAIGRCDEDVMTELVARNVAIKAAVVSADERERGERAHLNYGHTVGHALETLANYQMPHGSAVSLGMVAAGRLAVRMGLIESTYAARVESLLASFGLPVSLAQVDVPAVLRAMQHDKKSQAGQVRMVLPTGPGKVETFDRVDSAVLANAVASLTANRNA